MALDPFEVCLDLQLVSLLNPCKNTLHNILVLYRSAGCRLPSILAPIDIPCCDTVNRISTVGNNYDVSIFRDYLDRSQDCGEFSTLVGLPGSW